MSRMNVRHIRILRREKNQNRYKNQYTFLRRKLAKTYKNYSKPINIHNLSKSQTL